VRVASATRNLAALGLNDVARYVTYGASPRASINMILAGRALALVRGREYALPPDVRDVAHDVLRHRLVLSYEALADNVSSDDIIARILSTIPLPEIVLRERRIPAAGAVIAPIAGQRTS
jgi:MoxR-like ATPase